jgi:hypothetical protein
MCVKLFIEWSKATSGFEKHAAEIEGRLPLEFYLEAGTLDDPRAVSLVEKGAGCGCSCVEQAIWHSSVWTINPRLAGALAEAIVALAATAPFTLRAAWLGPDQPSESREALTVAALVERLRAGSLVPGRSYVASFRG